MAIGERMLTMSGAGGPERFAGGDRFDRGVPVEQSFDAAVRNADQPAAMTEGVGDRARSDGGRFLWPHGAEGGRQRDLIPAPPAATVSRRRGA